MKQIRLHYCDFPEGFDVTSDLMFRILSRHFEVTLTADAPDYVICSVFPDTKFTRRRIKHPEHFLYPDAIKIMISGENSMPDLNYCDYGIGFDYLDLGDRYLRSPLFAHYGQYDKLLESRPCFTADNLRAREHFCNFTFTNSKAMPERDQFFKLLNALKHVESTGPHLRNSPLLTEIEVAFPEGRHFSKGRLLERFKFSIAFENSRHPGYTTEKIMEPIAARCIPIYLGNPRVTEDFNAAAFINGHDFNSLDDLAVEVLRIDSDDTAFLNMVNADPLPASEYSTQSLRHQLENFLCRIAEQPKESARRRAQHGHAASMHTQLMKASRRIRNPWWKR